MIPLLLTATIVISASRTEGAQDALTPVAQQNSASASLAFPAKLQQNALLPALAAEIIDSLKNQPPTQTKGRLQIGIGRQLDHPFIVNARAVPAQDWTSQPDGTRTWTVSITSQGGLGIRLHIEALNLPASGRLLLYNGARPDLPPLITTYADLAGRDDLWMDTVFSDQVTLH